MKTVGISKFLLRQADPDFDKTRIPQEYFEGIRGIVLSELLDDVNVQDGYAPFCKVVPIKNLWDVKTSYVSVDDLDNGLIEGTLLPADYVSRREGEPAMPSTPTLVTKQELPSANYLHCILYTREHLEEEGEEVTGADLDLICVNAEMGMIGAPMTPSTLLRNALGPDFGGSGHVPSVEEYNKSVAFWQSHMFVKGEK